MFNSSDNFTYYLEYCGEQLPRCHNSLYENFLKLRAGVEESLACAPKEDRAIHLQFGQYAFELASKEAQLQSEAYLKYDGYRFNSQIHKLVPKNQELEHIICDIYDHLFHPYPSTKFPLSSLDRVQLAIELMAQIPCYTAFFHLQMAQSYFDKEANAQRWRTYRSIMKYDDGLLWQHLGYSLVMDYFECDTRTPDVFKNYAPAMEAWRELSDWEYGNDQYYNRLLDCCIPFVPWDMFVDLLERLISNPVFQPTIREYLEACIKQGKHGDEAMQLLSRIPT